MVLPDFKVSWELQCNVILYCIMSCNLEKFYLHCSAMFSLVCDAAGNEHNLLLEIPVVKKAFQDQYNWKNIMLPSRIKIYSLDLKFQWHTSRD